MTTSEAFLNAGAKSYIDALAAIEAFQNRVCRVCKRVYDDNQTQLVRVMGFDRLPCENYKYPEPEERFAELGVKKRTPEGHTFYLYLHWNEAESGEQNVSACVSLDFVNNRDRDDFYKKLHGDPACRIERGEDASYIWLRRELS